MHINMKIEHLAIWVNDLEKTRAFYETYFGASSNTKYHNKTKNFQSYFLSFESGCRLELMHNPAINQKGSTPEKQQLGLVHFALSVGDKQTVDALTNRLRADGYTIMGEPRTTGDGYYESVVLDPENNIIEITI